MDAIETLMHEHRLIERVLDGLEGFAGGVDEPRPNEKEELTGFVTFIREFADARHHNKEEDVLFKAMIENGFPAEGGPVGMMLHEHGIGRALVATLKEKAQQDAPWSTDDRETVKSAVASFSGLLRAHIQKEDGILYPMALSHLPAESVAQVNADCQRLETLRQPEHQRLLTLAEGLIARYGGEPRAPVPMGRFC